MQQTRSAPNHNSNKKAASNGGLFVAQRRRYTKSQSYLGIHKPRLEPTQ
jgi:hypothetical protein